ncbi:MAG: hypothetical protein KGR26_03540 [Cyanobacteria bacterium REEB65]|nr:hypothetical protein [Cyanobacteria bacterium REEB65]
MDKAAESTAGLKVLAVLMAIALWGFVSVSQRVDQAHKQLSVPIDVKNAPATFQARVLPAYAAVEVDGPSKAIDNLSAGDVTAFVDLQSRLSGGNQAEIKVSVPEGMNYQVEPEDVTVLLVPIRR